MAKQEPVKCETCGKGFFNSIESIINNKFYCYKCRPARYLILDINDVDELIQDSVDFNGLKDFIRGLWEDDDTPTAHEIFEELNKPVTFDRLQEMALGCDYDFREEK
jgi:hypothetical protein